MNAERLLKHFDRIAEAPGAVPRLRELILELAIRGRLVEQRPEEGDAKTLCGDDAITSDDAPFRIPPSWGWVTLSGLGCLRGGGTPSKHREEYWGGAMPWVSPKDMKVDYVSRAELSITEAAVEGSAAKIIPSGSLLFVVRGMILAHSFPVALSRVPVAINQDMKALVLAIPEMAEFLLRVLKGLRRAVLRRVERSTHGTCRLDGSAYRNLLIPVPPLAEQRRIVAKVDELMALCDRLEAVQRRREETRDRLVDSYEGRRRAHSYESSFNVPEVSSRHVSSLRRCILNLAVRGKLTSREPTDEPPAELIARIRAARQEDHRSRKRAGAAEDAIDTSTAPCDIPSAWRWVRTEDIAGRISDGVHKKPNYVASGVPFLTVKNLTEGSGISFRETKFVTETDHLEFIKRTNPERGDVLVTKDGTIGVSRIVDTDRPFSIFVSVALVKMIEKRIGPFLVLCFNSDVVRSAIVPKGAALKHLHLVDLRSLLVPLPSLEEQERIVAKVDELLTLCDRLETQLALSERESARFLEAVLHEALADEGATRSGPSSPNLSGEVVSQES